MRKLLFRTLFFIIFFLSFWVIPENAAASNASDSKRTTFIVSAEIGGDIFQDVINTNLTFSVGHSYENGLFLGAGTGVIGSWEEDVSFPLYAETRYNFPSNKKASPFVDVKMGPAISADGSKKVVMYCSPSIGVDFGKTSLYLSYREIKWGYANLGGIQIGFSFSF